jgi:hypothetical protein
MDKVNSNSASNEPRTPAWPINLGIGLATGIILGMLIASWGLRHENWQKAGLETVAAVMLVIVFVITAIASSVATFVRNGFRCSRLALIIVISIFVVVLVGIELFLEPIRARRTRIEKLTATGANFDYAPGPESRLVIFLGNEKYFRDVINVRWDCEEISNPDLTALNGLDAIETLWLTGIKCPPSNLEPLQSLPRLRELNLQGINISGDALLPLENNPCLTCLNIMDCHISDKSWECIGKINSLNGLNVYRTPVKDSELKYLANLTKLTSLNLNNTLITNDGLAFLGNCSNLQFLVLEESNITDQGLKHLGGLTKLKLLDLRGTYVTDEGIKELQQILPMCKISK